MLTSGVCCGDRVGRAPPRRLRPPDLRDRNLAGSAERVRLEVRTEVLEDPRLRLAKMFAERGGREPRPIREPLNVRPARERVVPVAASEEDRVRLLRGEPREDIGRGHE